MKEKGKKDDVKFILNTVGTIVSCASSFVYIKEVEEKLKRGDIDNRNEMNVLENKTAYLRLVDSAKTAMSMVNEMAAENKSEMIFSNFEHMDYDTISMRIILPLTKEYLERLI